MSHVYPAVRRPPKSRIPSLRTSSHFRRHSSQLELLKQDLQRKIFIEREEKLRILSAKNLGDGIECVVTPQQTRKVRSQPATLAKHPKVLGPIETTPKSTANRRYSLKSPITPPVDHHDPVMNGVTSGRDHGSNGHDRMASPGMKLDFEEVSSYRDENKVVSESHRPYGVPVIGGKLNKTPVLPPISSGSSQTKPREESHVHLDNELVHPTNGHARQNHVPKAVKEPANITPKTRRSPFPQTKTKQDAPAGAAPAKKKIDLVKEQAPLPAQLPESERGNLKLIIKRKEEELLRKIAAEERKLEEMKLQEEEEKRKARERKEEKIREEKMREEKMREEKMREEKAREDRLRIEKIARLDSVNSESSHVESMPIEQKKRKTVRKNSLPIELPASTRPEEEESSQDPVSGARDSAQFSNVPQEGEQNEIRLAECGICGRKFGEDRLGKHMTVCKKLSQKKERKKFDMTKQRAEGTDYASYVARGAHLKEVPKAKRKDWKTAHEEFQQIVQCAKTGTAPPPVSNPDYETCQYCNRRFNEAAYNRHVVHCKEKSMRRGPVAKKPVQRRR